MNGPVTQPWVHELTGMMQTVLLTAVRGPDGVAKYSPAKYILRWFRRCVLLSALDGEVLPTPLTQNGGSFTGPCERPPDMPYERYMAHVRHGDWQHVMDAWVTAYLRDLDLMPLHFHLHLIHAIEILGYKHPLAGVRAWWNSVYVRLVKDLHMTPETEETLDDRLGDKRDRWLAHGDEATNA